METEQFINIFKEEAIEQLGTLEDSLLELEDNPKDPELISALFRVMHTIKGSAGMVGLDKISSFAHELESILESVRSGEFCVNKGVIDHTLKARDIILKMIEDPEYDLADREHFFNDFKNSMQIDIKEEIESKDTITYRIVFEPGQNIFLTGNNPLILIQEILDLGDGIIIPYYNKIPQLSQLEPEKCFISWEIYITTSESINTLKDVFIFIEDYSNIKIEQWHENYDETDLEKLGDLLVKKGSLKSETLDNALNHQQKLGEILINEKILSEHEVKNALKAQSFINKNKVEKIESKTAESIRVNADKLDKLVDLVGEIVTINAQLLQLSHDSGNSRQTSIIERFSLLTEELRDNTMSLRMMPISSTFVRFKRLVRDLSGELGKKITMVTVGEDTELDKHVLEQLNDPLVHIIRNSIDHGIEAPDIRLKNGKQETGTLKLTAKHSGSSVTIIIEDDGKGLNRKSIRRKAVDRGLILEDEIISDNELLSLVFSPGFSTAENVTTVSGRGVGMDVVKRQIEQLKGHVYIESEEGVNCKITLVLPITLAIIEGLLVKISNDYFVIPLSSVEACVEIKDKEKLIQPGRRVITFRGKMVPYIDLRSFFNIAGKRKTIEQIVIVNSGVNQIGLLVDSVVGANQTVIKPLGSLYENLSQISGAAILGNGSVALVFDIDKLVRSVEEVKEVPIG